MVATNDAPVFMKIEGLILMTAVVVSLIFTYMDSVRLSADSIDLGLDSYTILTLRTVVGIAIIVCVYGMLIHSRACWILAIAGFIIMVRFNISNYDITYNLIPLILNSLALITLFRPSVIRFIFRMKKKDNVSADELSVQND